METQAIYVKEEKDLFWDRIFPPLGPAGIVIAGYYFMHRLALMRQRLEQAGRRLVAAQGFVDEIVSLSRKAWSLPGNSADLPPVVADIRYKPKRLGGETEVIVKDSRLREEVYRELAKFKRVVDEGIEAGHPTTTIDSHDRVAYLRWPQEGIAPAAARLHEVLDRACPR